MGWTGIHADFYKNGKVDRKAEMDYRWTQSESEDYAQLRVLKSSMVGSVYYAAVEVSENGKVKEVFGVTGLTSVDNNDYYNFSYKDIDETMGPYSYDCPIGILNLLTDTDTEYALEWTKKCRERHEEKKLARATRNKLVEGKKYKVKLYDWKEKTLVWYKYRGRFYFVDFDKMIRYNFNQVTVIEEVTEEEEKREEEKREAEIMKKWGFSL